MLKDAARALSLANLCFITIWSWLLSKSLSPYAQYARYRFNEYTAILINVLILASIFWLAAIIVRRYDRKVALRAARVAFLIILIVPISGIVQTQFPVLAVKLSRLFVESSVATPVAIILMVAAGFIAIRFHDYLFKIASVVILMLSPFVLFTFGKGIYLITEFRNKPTPPSVQSTNPNAPRVLWLIFDEMDQRLAFSERPQGLLLPELDRLRHESIFATNARSPSDKTLTSLPALITGRKISTASVETPSQLMVRFEGTDEAVRWGDQPNVFSETRKLGHNTALIGWYHPYCRMIGDSLNRCVFAYTKDLTLSRTMLNQARDVLLSLPFVSSRKISVRGESVRPTIKNRDSRSDHLQMYSKILDAAKTIAIDTSFGLTLAHFNVPHMPAIYNRRLGELGSGKDVTYLDNLALVDRTLGELRRRMEDAGVWDKTVVLVTSDHPLRKKNFKKLVEKIDGLKTVAEPGIPFLLKLPEQKQSVKYDGRFNSLLTRDLLIALLSGELQTTESVIGWLDNHSSETATSKAKD